MRPHLLRHFSALPLQFCLQHPCSGLWLVLATRAIVSAGLQQSAETKVMATMSGDGSNGGGAPGPEVAGGAAPSFSVLVQYSKDFSFENPNAPQSLVQQQQQQPQIAIQINVNPRQLSETDYEVELKLEGKAENNGNVLFAFDLNFAGVFRLVNIPQESVGPLLMIECPRLLFPFAREIVSGAIASGGFPPLLLNPVDFVQLYQQKAAEMQAAQQQQPAAQA
jgi:preprotein translocase subunit SecB